MKGVDEWDRGISKNKRAGSVKATGPFGCKNKKWHRDVAPLQPPTLALFPAWGSSAGAGRTPLPGAKVRKKFRKGRSDTKKKNYGDF